jgi:hypothetical protein
MFGVSIFWGVGLFFGVLVSVERLLGVGFVSSEVAPAQLLPGKAYHWSSLPKHGRSHLLPASEGTG